ncbi:helix-turn-helix domain-containing protein [soil metagenome]
MDTALLKKTHMFSSLNEEELEKINLISKVKTYNRGESIFFDTEPYNGFYIILKGLVKVFKISKDGKEHILHLIDRHNSFAEVPLFENSDNILLNEASYPANAVALEDYTQVVLVSAIPFLKLIEKNNKLCLKMISGFAKRLRTLTNHIEDITLKDVTKRVAGYILSEFTASQIAEHKENVITLKISKNDLASYMGTIIETLSRTFKKLQDDKLIDVEGKTITILDPDGLKKLSS